MRYLWIILAATVAACGQGNQTIPNGARLVAQPQQSLVSRTTHEWYVDGRHGSNRNDCKSPQHACKTIRHAIELCSQGDSIKVAPGTYFENLSIPVSLSIFGSGPRTTILDGRHLASVFLITHRRLVVTLSGMTMRNAGGIGDGGAVYNCFTKSLTIVNSILTGNSVHKGSGTVGFGGAIYNCPTTGTALTIIDSTFSNNTAEEGGAICSGGALTIINSTFYGNVARHHRGGAIRNYGLLTITNSTFANNDARGGIGGAIHNGKYIGLTGALLMSSSTVSGNNGVGIYNGPGITATLRNSIVANNAGGDCRGVVTSDGYNLSSDGTCNFNNTGDLNNADPKLGPLGRNGGPTPTMALRAGSPAIDAGNPNGCTDGRRVLTTDQRGRPRPDPEDSSGCDIGAFERQGD
ncbi:MAG TPA: choice-of-anchor Q domain-containing protein [Candidatus Cybelea sp.]